MYLGVFVGAGELPVPLLHHLYPSLTTSSLPIRLWWILGCFHSLAVVNNDAVMNTEMHVSLWGNIFLFSLDIYPRMELLGRILSPVLVFWGSLHTVFHSGYTNWHSYLRYRVCFSPHPPLNFVICDLFHDRRSDGCAVIAHFVCVFILFLFLLEYSCFTVLS